MRRRLGKVVAGLERRGCRVVVRLAALRGDVERLAREAEPAFDVIVAAGGDGTANAVINGLADNPRTVAVLPFGTANVLAHEIGLPRQSDALAALLAEAEARPAWPGRIGDRLFLMMAGIGFDAEVVSAVDPRLKRWVGRLAFLSAILMRLIRYRGCELLVRIDGVEHRATALIAAKGRFYAGPFMIAPAANLSEPVLDLLLFQDDGRSAVLRYFGALVLGRLARLRSITRLRGSSAYVSALEGAGAGVQTDGEIVGQLPVTIGVAAQPIPLIRP